MTDSTATFEQRRADFWKGLRICLWLIAGLLAWGIAWFGGIWPQEYYSSGLRWEALAFVLPLLIPVLCLFSWDLIEYFLMKRKQIGGAGVWSNRSNMIWAVIIPAMGGGLLCLAYGVGALTVDFPTCFTQILLLLLVPVGNRIVWSSLLSAAADNGASQGSSGNKSGDAWRLPLLNGMAIGVSLFYVLFELLLLYKLCQHASFSLQYWDWGVFLPACFRQLTQPWIPASLVTIAAPVAALLSSSKLRAELLRRKDKQEGASAARLSILGAVLSLLAIFGPGCLHTFNRVVAFQSISKDYPYYGFSYNTQQQNSEKAALAREAEKQRAGIRILRAGANQQTLLEDCYAPSVELAALIGCLLSERTMDSVSTEDFRDVFYRVYGKSVSEFPVPWRFVPAIWMQDMQRGFQHVGVKAAGLKLAESNIQGVVDSNAAVAYLEWTFTFQNDSTSEQEARSQISLPPGAVISRATLWVRGKESEAAITERGLATRTYQAIVATRRDPLLVTSAGKDLALLQCFPVPSHGQMKAKIGITAPVVVDSASSCHLALPSLTENNFEPPSVHDLEITSNGALALSNQEQGQQKSGDMSAGARIHKVHQSISNDLLRSSNTVLSIARDASKSFRCQTHDSTSSDPGYYVESIEEATQQVKHAVIVIDGSLAVGKHKEELARALRGLPHELSTTVFFVSDEITSLSSAGATAGGVNYKPEMARELERAPFVGGPDNWNYLMQAWHDAANKPHSVVIWIHGPQPNLPKSYRTFDFFIPGFEAVGSAVRDGRRESPFSCKENCPGFYDVEVERGPNRIREMFEPSAFKNTPNLLSLDRKGSLDQDLITLFERLAGKKPAYTVKLAKESKLENCPEVEVTGASSCLVKLWAYGESLRLLRAGQAEEAQKLASANKLITPVTAAIVLETRQQYKDAGITTPGAKPDNSASMDKWLGGSTNGTTNAHAEDSFVVNGLNTAASARDANLFSGGEANSSSVSGSLRSAPSQSFAQASFGTGQLNKLNAVTNSNEGGSPTSTAEPKPVASQTPAAHQHAPAKEDLKSAQTRFAGEKTSLAGLIVLNLIAATALAFACWLFNSARKSHERRKILFALLLAGGSILLALSSTVIAHFAGDIGSFFFS